MSKSIKHLQSINKNDEWITPTSILRKALFDYDIYPYLDVCATELNHKFEQYYSKENDGLNQEWDQNFFMNPPYSEITQWMKKAYEQHQKYNVNALILTFAKTDTKWWHKYVEDIAEVHFIKGRLKFLTPENIPSKNSAPYPSSWIIYRGTRY